MGRKIILSDSERGMVLVDGLLLVLQKLQIYSDFPHAIVSGVFRKWSEKRGEKKNQRASGENALLKSEENGHAASC